MKQFLFLQLIATLALGNVSAASLEENEFFQDLKGKWTGTGSMTNAQGESEKLENEIQTGFRDDGATFFIRGSLRIAGAPDTDRVLDYEWQFSKHTLEGLYRGVLVDLGDGGEDREFEVSVNEADRRARLTETSASSGGSRIELVKKLEGDNYRVEFRFIDSSGNETLSGNLEFKRT